MDVEDLFERSHLLLNDRRCRSCGEVKNLIDGFYLIRKNRENISSSYSYECKDCTKKRVSIARMNKRFFDRWEYPDW
jgi:hypothetical protein|tara:strand:+ start:1632 stop:1862 length:231 start_codon:yes stop_codon:yes gene_type:complete